MIFEAIKYKIGCIEHVGDFNISSIKFTVLSNSYSETELEIQMMIKNDLRKKLYLRGPVQLDHLFVFKKKLSKKNVATLMFTIFMNSWKPTFVNYWYLPDDNKYYHEISKPQEIYV